jgi:hypothetical protein
MCDECFAVILGIERVCSLVSPLSRIYEMLLTAGESNVGEHVCYISPAYMMVFLLSVIYVWAQLYHEALISRA